MANTETSDLNGMYFINSEPEVWEIKKKGFWKWLIRHRLKPGDIIPKRIFKKYFKRVQ